MMAPKGDEMTIAKEDWEFQIGYLEELLSEHGYLLIEDTDEEDRIEFDERAVYLNSRLHPETRFYTLLHELGHLDIFVNGAQQFQDEHPMYIQHQDGRSPNGKAYRVSLLAEELEAWRRGRRIARQEGMIIDDFKYDKMMTDCVMSYINWAAD